MLFLISTFLPLSVSAETKTIHDFTVSVIDGEQPYGALVSDGNVLYGATYGQIDRGGVFSVNRDGTNFKLLHEFSGIDGESPQYGLTLSGDTLYGTTTSGGSNDAGLIFSIKTDGSDFMPLYEFGENSDGSSPIGPLVLFADTLYGVTPYGGSNDFGTIFSINTDGTDFTLLHTFLGGNGAYPQAGLTISGDMLYGTTFIGGDNERGTVFSINTNGTDFTLLHSFSGRSSDGSYPEGVLTKSGDVLYGTTDSGGSGGYGVVFSVHSDGTNFLLLHEFTWGVDAISPQGAVTLLGDTLYGATQFGQSYEPGGTLFSMKTDGSEFTFLHEFDGENDGSYPVGSLLLIDNTFYGVASSGGSKDYGMLFSFDANTSVFTTSHEFVGFTDEGYYPDGALISSGGRLYGTTASGGVGGKGTIFSINEDGSDLILLHEFSGTDGQSPRGGLVLVGDTLYGAASYGGEYSGGTLFSLKVDGSGFVLLHEFVPGYDDGYNPNGFFIIEGDTLYGTTYSGGEGNGGVVFSIKTDGSDHTLLHKFSYSEDGYNPNGSLVLVGDTLYGTTYDGFYNGTIFSLNIEGDNFTILHRFTGGIGGGVHPEGGLTLIGDTFFGVTRHGGADGTGNVFSINLDGTNFTSLYEFPLDDESMETGSIGPIGSFVLYNGIFYGVTSGYGGEGGCGGSSLFSINPDGTNFTRLHSFLWGTNDGFCPNGSLVLAGNALYGTTYEGGSYDIGTIFSYVFPTQNIPSEEQPQEENKNQPSYDLNKPKDLTLNCSSKDRRILLTWKDDSKEEEGNIIQRKTNDGSWKTVKTSKTENREDWTDDNLEPNTYTYRVRSFHDDNESNYSNEASCTIEASTQISLATTTTTTQTGSSLEAPTSEDLSYNIQQENNSSDLRENIQPNSEPFNPYPKTETKDTTPSFITKALAPILERPTVPSMVLSSLALLATSLRLLSFPGLFSFRTGNSTVSTIGLFNKKRSWGTTYDARTGNILPYVTLDLINQETKKKETILSDKYGRFGFLVPGPETYILQASKEGYIFRNTPTNPIVAIANVYQGEPLTLTEQDIVKKNIFLEGSKKTISPFVLFLRSISMRFFFDIVFAVSSLFTLLAFFKDPTNTLAQGLLLFNILLLLIRFFIPTSHQYGEIRHTFSQGMTFASITVQNQQGTMLSRTMADQYGRYFIFLDPGTYIVTINVQNPTTGQSKEAQDQITMEKGGLLVKRWRV